MTTVIVRRPPPSVVLAALAIAMTTTSACRRTPNAEEGRQRLAGHYTFFDRRVPEGGINPNFKSASLELRADGAASQTCEFNDGKRYQSANVTWSYDGDGNVTIRPIKDCSWVYGGRDGPLDVPDSGASLIVEWLDKPVILLDPDINAFYEHR